jgi:uncharacterized membrane protein
MRCVGSWPILIAGFVNRHEGVVMINTEGTRSLGMALGAAVVASAGLMVIYYYGGVMGNADQTPVRAAIVGTVGAVIAGFVAWRYARGVYTDEAVDRLARRTAVVGVIAVLSLAGFWVGITVPLSVAAVALGLRVVAAGRPVRGNVTVSVGVVVLIASTILCVLGAS